MPTPESFKIEFLLARADKTWDTEVFDIPITLEDECNAEIVNWLEENILYQEKYKEIVGVCLYSVPNEED